MTVARWPAARLCAAADRAGRPGRRGDGRGRGQGLGPDAVAAAAGSGLVDIGGTRPGDAGQGQLGAARDPLAFSRADLSATSSPGWRLTCTSGMAWTARSHALALAQRSPVRLRAGPGEDGRPPGRHGASPARCPRLVDSARRGGPGRPGADGGRAQRRPRATEVRRCFRDVASLAASLGLSELSMGMSADFELAVAEGATIVRLGTALFGPRPAAVVPGAGRGQARLDTKEELCREQARRC